MKKIAAITAATLIALSGAAVAAPAAQQEPALAMQKMQKGELPRDLQELNLSSKQKAQIQTIMEANRPQMPEGAPEMRGEGKRDDNMKQAFAAEQAAEQKLISSKNFDEAAARKLVSERQAKMQQHMAEHQQKQTDHEIKRLKERHDIFQVLNSQQQKQWLENQSKHQPHGEPMMHREAPKAEQK